MKNNNIQFNWYSSWLSRDTEKKVDLDYVLHHIKNGDENAERIEEARRLGKSDDRYQQTKSSLPVIPWNATFSNLKKKGYIQTMTGFIFFDKDNLSDDEIKSYKELLMTFPYVLAVWKSFGGKGVGCVVKCDQVTQDNFSNVWDAIDEAVGIGFDPGVRKVTQVNALSFDPDIRVNDFATSFFYEVKEKPNVSRTSYNGSLNYSSSSSFDENGFNYTVNTSNNNNLKPLNYLSRLSTIFPFIYNKPKVVFETQHDTSLSDSYGCIEYETPIHHTEVNEHYIITEGKRNHCLKTILSALLVLNPSVDKALLYFHFSRINQSQCKPPYPEKELKSMFNSFYRKQRQGKLYATSRLRYIYFEKHCTLTRGERLSRAGKIGRRVRKNNTTRSIEHTIEHLVQEQKKITKKLVASVANRTPKIVARHWDVFEDTVKAHNEALIKKR
ncbi:MAG: BT4734/BF3469 family protein [Bacteroidota bacterium]